MRNIDVTKDKFGFSYRTNPFSGFINFPDGIHNKQDMIKFFTEGRHVIGGRPGYDAPQITFVDATGKPINYYQVKRGEPYNVGICNFDPAKKILFDAKESALEYLKQFSSADDLNASEKIIEIDSKIDFLKREASPDTLKELEDLIAAKNSDEGLKEFCTRHAKQYYNLPAIIEFID